jgi:hypothetical protein
MRLLHPAFNSFDLYDVCRMPHAMPGGGMVADLGRQECASNNAELVSHIQLEGRIVRRHYMRPRPPRRYKDLRSRYNSGHGTAAAAPLPSRLDCVSTGERPPRFGGTTNDGDRKRGGAATLPQTRQPCIQLSVASHTACSSSHH